MPTSGKSLVIVGTDNNGLLHIRVFDANGNRVTDTDETKLPSTQAVAISALKQQLLGLLPPNVLTVAEKAQVIGELTSILGQTLLNTADGLYRITYGTLSGFGLPELAAGELADPGRHPGGGRGVSGTHGGGQRWHRDAPAPLDMSDATGIPPAIGIGADPGRRVLLQHRSGGPRRAEAARLQAVDAALSSWQPDGQAPASPPFVGGRSSHSFRAATTRVVAARSPMLGP